MSLWRTLRGGLRTLFHKDAVTRELDDELAHYVAMATAENVRRGMSPADAERAARVRLGSAEATKSEVRTGGWESVVESLVQDCRVAFRGLARAPGFTAVAVATLALGIGANTTMFSVVNAVLFRPLPWRDAGHLALLWTDDTRRSLHTEPTAYLTVADWKRDSRTFSDIAFYATQRVSPMHHDPTRGRGRSRVGFASENLFPLLGVAPARGRFIAPEDLRDRAPVAVITHAFWMRWFDGDTNVVGRTISVDEGGKGGVGTLTVIGVMPPEFYFPDAGTEMWTPATRYWRWDREATERHATSMRRWIGVGRLAPGASMADARDDLARIGRRLADTYPTSLTDFPGFGVNVVPVLDSVAGANVQLSLWILLATVGAVLLVVCVNVANLMLARGAARHREFTVRRALGAGRARIVRQLAVECAALVFVGGVVGTTLAAWATPALGSAVSAYVPRMNEIALDWRVLSFAVVACVVAGLASGVAPALRLSAADAGEALREGAGGTATGRLRRTQGALVLAECALALVLLAGAGLLLRSLGRLNAVDPGFDPRNVLTVRLEFPPVDRTMAAALRDPATADTRILQAYSQLLRDIGERVGGIPGVASVGFMDDLFIAGRGNKVVTIPGRSADEFPAGELNDGSVAAGFFSVLRVPLRSGRLLDRGDADTKVRALFTPIARQLSLAEKERVAVAEPVVVNEAFVRRYFANENPVGKRFCIDPENKTYFYEIVGVVGDMRRQGLDRAAIPEYFGPYVPGPGTRVDLLVRTSGNPAALGANVRAEVLRAVPGMAVVSINTAETGLGGFAAQRRVQAWLLTLFAGVALALAAIGIFGLAHYAVSARAREIAVRVALGATPGDVVRLVVVQSMRMPALGIAVGIAAAAALTRIIANQLYDVTPTDPLTFAAVAALLALIATSACWLAARRAAKSDPVKVLRT